MSRRTAREHAFILIFELGFYEEFDVSEKIESHILNYADLFEDLQNISDDDKSFIYNEVSGTRQNLETIDGYISKYSKKWTVDRMSSVDVALLRLAIYEIFYDDTIPEKVSINEAVELAKTYADNEGANFVNGLLASVITEKK